MIRTTCFALLFSSVTLFGTGCGGGLKYTINDNTIAATSSADREQINVARNDQMRAEDAQRETARNETTSENELAVAENEYKSAKLQRDNAKTQKKMAEQGGDFNVKNKADRDYVAADKAADAAEAKRDWLDKKHKWAKTMREANDLQVKLDKAKVELEKAKLCSTKNIRPSEKFSVSQYDQQVSELQTKFDEKRHDADNLHLGVDDKMRKYESKKSSAESAKAAAQ